MTSVYINAICTFRICWSSPVRGYLSGGVPGAVAQIPFEIDINGQQIQSHLVDMNDWSTAIAGAEINQRS